MWFLTGFIGTPVVVGIINALLTALMSVASTRHSRRKLLLGAKEHLVFFGVLGVGLYIGLNLDTGHLGNNVPSGIWCHTDRGMAPDASLGESKQARLAQR